MFAELARTVRPSQQQKRLIVRRKVKLLPKPQHLIFLVKLERIINHQLRALSLKAQHQIFPVKLEPIAARSQRGIIALRPQPQISPVKRDCHRMTIQVEKVPPLLQPKRDQPQ